MRISFWRQKDKGQGHRRQWPENLVNTISQQVAQLWQKGRASSAMGVGHFEAKFPFWTDQEVLCISI